MQSIPEHDLIDLLKEHDEAAFRQVYTMCYPMAVRFVTQNSGTTDEAEDVFQDALVALIKNLKRDDFTLDAKLSTYMYAIVRYKWLYKLRGKKPLTSLQSIVHLPSTMEDDDETRVKERQLSILADILQALDDPCRKLITDFYYEKKPMPELADELGYTYAFVRVKKTRCMEEYRKRVREHPDMTDEMI